MTTQEKANLMATEIDNGFYNYFDRCYINEDGTFTYYCADNDTSVICSADELAAAYDALRL